MTGKMRSFFKVFMIFAIVIGVGLAVATPAMAEEKSGTIFYAEALQNCENPVSEPNSTYNQTMKAYQEDDGCWFCGIFNTIYVAISNLVTKIFDQLAKEFLKLMGVGILFLLLFKVGKMLVSLQEVDVMQFLNDLFRPLGRAIIATAFLTASVAAGNGIFAIVITPFMDAAFILGQQLQMKEGGPVDTYVYVETTHPDGSKTEERYAFENGACNYIGMEPTVGEKQALNRDTQCRMYRMLKDVSASLILGIGMGVTFMKVGFDTIDQGGVPLIVSGLIMWCAFWAVYIMFPLKLFDPLCRLAFVLALMPLWIVLWVFPATVEYTKKAWNMFLSSCLLFVVLSVMVSLALTLMDHALTPEDIKVKVVNCLKADMPRNAAVLFSVSGKMTMNTLCFGFMAWSLLAAAEPLANSFIPSGGSLNIGGSVASNVAKLGMVAGKTARMAAPVAAKAGGAVLGGALRGGGAALGKFNDKLANAGGALPNKAQKALRALGTPLGKGYMDKVSGKVDPNLNNVGQDTASLTPEAAATVGTRAAERASRMAAITSEKGFTGQYGRLRKMIRNGKTPEERKLLTAMAQDLLRKRKTADAGKVDPRLQRALSDEYARQAIANNPLVKAENQRRQENLDNTNNQRKPAEQQGQPNDEAKREQRRTAEDVSGRLAKLNTEAIRSMLKKDPKMLDKMDKFARDISAIEAVAKTSKTHAEFRTKMEGLQQAGWQGGNPHDPAHKVFMDRVGERIYNANGKEISSGITSQSIMNEYLSRNTDADMFSGTGVAQVAKEVSQRAEQNVREGREAGISAAITAVQAELKKVS